MADAVPEPTSGARLLPAGTGSLARGLPPAEPGTLFVLSSHGGISVPPQVRMDVVFGRAEPDVHVCVGPHDRHVSRRHGVLRTDGVRWLVRNEGKVPIRLPGAQLLLGGQYEVLPAAYTPLFIPTPVSEHLLEVRIAGAREGQPAVQYEATTDAPMTWRLSEPERLVLTVLGQRYLRHEMNPQPLSWSVVAEELSELRPAERWTEKRVAHIVADVRERLSRTGVKALRRDEVGEPVGNTLNHNLLTELLVSTTLVPPDLALLDASGGTSM